MDLMHCGVRFLLCEVFNYTFPLLTVHVLASLRAVPSNPTALSRSVLFAEVAVPGAPVSPVLVGSIVFA